MWFFSFHQSNKITIALYISCIHVLTTSTVDSHTMAIRMPFSAFGICLSTSYKQEINKNRMLLHMKSGNGKQRYNVRIMSSMMICDSDITPDPTPSEMIKEFYKCMNEKNVKRLENYLAKDCFFEDYSFPKPFSGKKEVSRFLKQLTAGMGPNVEFRVSHIYEGDDDLIAGVNWHLEWKNKQVPFTRGCSLYRLTREGERLTIRNAQVFVESPIKPGDLFLVLLKIVTSLFDAFPEATEWFFRSQKMIVQVLLKIYSMFLVPFISPIVSFYVNLGKVIVQFVSIALKILEWCYRFFTTTEN
ncbi:putative NTF2-like domain superfamily, SnoaL-like domain-containing protein [Helianthus annuus]|uniref:NTF2-like domain superfamily, SnoaL-like domain-containing protein n=3 Tax=Helianthus annuus TaxID=4232 RepID=A0A9K3EG55_HELAN|nr:putative NTF2-like domain superfamily, SnoaL-like domain-containing protein [Helianthus annuus]KAJ0476082.1 putative NTF2-like domain superfamily, SnoaL-like domain-containing protein [Helianthus annuus]KAJ0480145.1 putative NTF2-like domain superfamily, SnoaL-like domain-containing protein [Helianthus annuus]KAJ0496886.1 putative NTF2-like domain superfamily, SnoaL-like domain-containing protein [Helianthus annuus]KAJ0662917.1 putative NTF2-like domain superfamily, SnoaL-like domain-contain